MLFEKMKMERNWGPKTHRKSQTLSADTSSISKSRISLWEISASNPIGKSYTTSYLDSSTLSNSINWLRLGRRLTITMLSHLTLSSARVLPCKCSKSSFTASRKRLTTTVRRCTSRFENFYASRAMNLRNLWWFTRCCLNMKIRRKNKRILENCLTCGSNHHQISTWMSACFLSWLGSPRNSLLVKTR